jgi:pilus assembly protein FimV
VFKSTKRNVFHASVMAAALSLSSVGALAAGLGKFTVLSQLGQPLRAELDIAASREELASMVARLAPNDAFKQVGIEYAPILAGMKFTLDKRPDGRPFVRISTDRPVNDPFLDMLVELTWASGRVVREYTVLLDPPAEVQKPAPAPVAVPESRAPVAVAPKTPETPAAPAASVASRTIVPSAPAASPAAAGDGGRLVKAGDTLAKIARENKGEGVSLDQMLVALFRSNPAAFDGGNMNRLKTGRILSIPDAVAAAEVPAAEARQIIVSQSADFNAYRQRLAATVAAAPAAKEAAPRQEAAGKITPKVEERPPAAPAGKDKLEVSRTEAAKGAQADKALQGRITALEEDLVARERSLKEANSRIADLERNIADLKKLAEMKSQAGAQLQQQAQAAKPVPAEKAAEPVAAAKPAPVEPPKPAEPAKPPVEAVPPVAEKPPVPVATETKPAEQPAAPKKPVAPPPPPAPEPDFLEENGALVYGGGGVLALLLGYLGFSAWRRKQQATGGPTTSRISEGDLTANSVFGTTGGQAVDTGASIQTDFSQSSLGAIDADEGVDPVAEADVYMAYGRDAQAEEILIDALKNDPARHAIHLKLLEIYAGRKSLKQFEELATDLHGQTGGNGSDWEKAAALGRSIDPENTLYGGKPDSSAVDRLSPLPDLAATTVIIPPAEPPMPAAVEQVMEPVAEKLRDTVTLPGQLAQMASEAEVPPVAPALDFDLDLGAPEVVAEAPAADTTALDFDLDLGVAAPEPAVKSPPPLRPDEMTHLNLDLPTGVADMVAVDRDEPTHINVDFSVGESGTATPAAAEATGLDFEFDLGAEAPAAPAAAAEMPLDLAAVDLELPEGEAAIASPASGDEDNPDVTTKLELAQAYEEMGDKEGARELLQEVLNEGSPQQQEAARGKLASLDA